MEALADLDLGQQPGDHHCAAATAVAPATYQQHEEQHQQHQHQHPHKEAAHVRSASAVSASDFAWLDAEPSGDPFCDEAFVAPKVAFDKPHVHQPPASPQESFTESVSTSGSTSGSEPGSERAPYGPFAWDGAASETSDHDQALAAAAEALPDFEECAELEPYLYPMPSPYLGVSSSAPGAGLPLDGLVSLALQADVAQQQQRRQHQHLHEHQHQHQHLLRHEEQQQVPYPHQYHQEQHVRQYAQQHQQPPLNNSSSSNTMPMYGAEEGSADTDVELFLPAVMSLSTATVAPQHGHHHEQQQQEQQQQPLELATPAPPPPTPVIKKEVLAPTPMPDCLPSMPTPPVIPQQQQQQQRTNKRQRPQLTHRASSGLSMASEADVSQATMDEIMCMKQLLQRVQTDLKINSRGERDFQGLKRAIASDPAVRPGVRDFLNASFKQKVKNLCQERHKRAQLNGWKALRAVPDLRAELRRRLYEQDKYDDSFIDQLAEYLGSLIVQRIEAPGNILDWPEQIRQVVIDKCVFLHKHFYGNRFFRMYEDLGFLFAVGELQLAVFSKCTCTDCVASWDLASVNVGNTQALKLHWMCQVAGLLERLIDQHLSLGTDMFSVVAEAEPKLRGWDRKEINVLLKALHTSTKCDICKQSKRARHRGEHPASSVTGCCSSDSEADPLHTHHDLDTDDEDDDDDFEHHGRESCYSEDGSRSDVTRQDHGYLADLMLENVAAFDALQLLDLD